METGIARAIHFSTEQQHGSYLQGMETVLDVFVELVLKLSTDPTYKEWKPSSEIIDRDGEVARILPTRNGNYSCQPLRISHFRGTDPTYKEWKLSICNSHYLIISKRTDPTYKEWKPDETDMYAIKAVGTDPTYKEWKQGYGCHLPNAHRGTDPTYKEWKHLRFHSAPYQALKHGSYLQGMETNLPIKLILNGLIARILPTRNGNSSWVIILAISTFSHGSYLQGMETGHGSLERAKSRSTDPTYKEWKLLSLMVGAVN